MKLLPEWLLSAISDGDKDNPQTSMGRLACLLVIGSCILLPIIQWSALSSTSGKLLDIPASVMQFMGAAATAVVSMYAITKYSEK